MGGVLGKSPELRGKRLRGGPQMLQLSLDGRRLYVTTRSGSQVVTARLISGRRRLAACIARRPILNRRASRDMTSSRKLSKYEMSLPENLWSN